MNPQVMVENVNLKIMFKNYYIISSHIVIPSSEKSYISP